MIRINNLDAGYKNTVVLHAINLTIKAGVLTTLIGPNGSGKSTLLKTIAGILRPIQGTLLLDNEDIVSMNATSRAQRIAYLPQSANSFPSITVFEAILLGRKPYISFEPEKRDLLIVEETIKKFNIEEYAFKRINELSGGQIQKVLIARAIAQKTNVLLLDEPINHLDMKNQIEIMDIIKQYTIESGLMTIVVLHDINRALQFADEFVLLHNGYIVDKGDSTVITPGILEKVYNVKAHCIEYKKRKIIVV